MPYKTHKYKRYKSFEAYRKAMAYQHIHNIPHTHHRYVEIKKGNKWVKHKVMSAVRKRKRKR
ncbi:MAG: hypothetical protein QW203_06765 [Thermoplasmatales archaeon]